MSGAISNCLPTSAPTTAVALTALLSQTTPTTATVAFKPLTANDISSTLFNTINYHNNIYNNNNNNNSHKSSRDRARGKSRSIRNHRNNIDKDKTVRIAANFTFTNNVSAAGSLVNSDNSENITAPISSPANKDNSKHSKRDDVDGDSIILLRSTQNNNETNNLSKYYQGNLLLAVVAASTTTTTRTTKTTTSALNTTSEVLLANHLLPMESFTTSSSTNTTNATNDTTISSSASLKFDVEIDIQLLPTNYQFNTMNSNYYNETMWLNKTKVETEPVDGDPAMESFIVLLIVGVLLSVLIFLSIAGNILVCLAIYTERSLRRIGNLFLASLAIADLFVASLVMTFAGINDILGYWIFGAEFCDTWVAFDVMCSTASILNLCAISLDRYIHIKDPLRYGRWVTRRVAVVTIGTIWLLAAFVSFVPISLGLHRPVQPPLVVEDNGKEYPTCALDLTPTYAVVSSCISFYFPCVVMIGIYCRLYCYAQKHVKSIKAITRPGEIAEKQRYRSIRRPNKLHPKKFKVRSLQNSSPYHVSDHKAAITVGVIMGVFLICWVPFFCVNIVAAFCKTCIGDQTFKILSWLGYSNSAFNPIIYSIFNKEFRDAFKRLLTTRNPCCTQDVGNVYPRNSDRFVTDYDAKHVSVNSGRSSAAELEQVSAI